MPRCLVSDARESANSEQGWNEYILGDDYEPEYTLIEHLCESIYMRDRLSDPGRIVCAFCGRPM